MQRAGVFIGVNRTGQLQTLNDASGSARRMHAWAVSQGMKDGSGAILIADDGPGAGAVTPDRIFEAVKTAISTGPEQLIVYFAGHGVVIRRHEQWLLTNAPGQATHAVDMGQSSEDAAYGQVPHVVLISDACRTAPHGIEAGNVAGGSIFENMPSADARFVDLYFACGLGRPAGELKTQDESVAAYRAVYTEVMLEALGGKFRDSLAERDGAWYAEARPLRDLLAREVPERIRSRKLKVRFEQSPQAHIGSDPGVWLSRLEALPRELQDRDGDLGPAPPAVPTLELVQEEVVDRAIAGDTPGVGDALATLEDDAVPGGANFVRDLAALSRTFGAEAFETQCGFKVEGATITGFFPSHPEAEVLHDDTSLRLRPPNRAASMLMAFDNGLVTLLPAVQDFIAALVFDDDELIAVSYEPAKNSWRYPEYAGKMEHLRSLRAVAASCSLHGRFSLEVEDSDTVASSMQLSKSYDPSLAIYAAYAYHDLHKVDRISQMSTYLRNDIGTTFFDLELLSRHLIGRGVTPTDRILPWVPLLTQGWAVARAHRTELSRGLRDVERYARDSLWSVYDAGAFRLFQQCLSEGTIR